MSVLSTMSIRFRSVNDKDEVLCTKARKPRVDRRIQNPNEED